MKPLELTIYPIWDSGDGTLYADRGNRQYPTNVGYEVYRKRLTEPELAAEYYAQQMESVRAFDRAYPYGESEEVDIENARIEVVERFATLPHYDEDPK